MKHVISLIADRSNSDGQALDSLGGGCFLRCESVDLACEIAFDTPASFYPLLPGVEFRGRFNKVFLRHPQYIDIYGESGALPSIRPTVKLTISESNIVARYDDRKPISQGLPIQRNLDAVKIVSTHIFVGIIPPGISEIGFSARLTSNVSSLASANGFFPQYSVNFYRDYSAALAAQTDLGIPGINASGISSAKYVGPDGEILFCGHGEFGISQFGTGKYHYDGDGELPVHAIFEPIFNPVPSNAGAFLVAFYFADAGFDPDLTRAAAYGR